MPPRKRKLNQDEDTDDEKTMKQTKLSFSKRGAAATVNGDAGGGKQLKFDLEWNEHGDATSKNVRPLIYLWSKTLPGKAKVAAFDIDNTIIVTKSGKKFATNAQDWTWFDKTVPVKLKELHDDDFRIVFITNQAGIEKGHTKPSELKSKFESMIKELDIPVYIFIATGETHFRKPSIEMWRFFEKNCNQSVVVDMKESFFVGDAAGRPKNWAPGKPKDFSCADRMFASNTNLKFYTPEELFLKQKPAPFEWGSINPKEVLEKHTTSNTASSKTYHSSEQELILMIGPPASGKSTFTKSHFVKHGYVSVNRDTLSTQEKCLKVAQASLSEGKSVVVDNTNPSRKVRADYISLAKKLGVKKIRCFRMSTPIDLCHHLNYVRQNQTSGQVRRIPDVGYNMFKNQFEEPQLSEGLDDIVTVDFSPRFETERDEVIFKQWTA